MNVQLSKAIEWFERSLFGIELRQGKGSLSMQISINETNEDSQFEIDMKQTEKKTLKPKVEIVKDFN